MADLSPEVADNGADGYLAGRAMAQRAGVDRQWESLVAPAPKTSAAPQPQAQPQTEGDALPVMPDYWDQLSPGSRLVATPRMVSSGISQIGSAIGATAKDVGKGVIDSPRQAIGGALDFVNNVWNFADTVVKKAEAAGMPNAYFRLFDEAGKFDPRIESEADFRAAQTAGKEHIFQVPTTGEPDTVTGQIVRQSVPFIIGRGTSGSAMGALGGTLPGEVARDFISGAVSQNPETPRLSNIIDQVAPNAVTDFLKAKPGDEGTVLGRIKSGLEFAGLGAAVGGAIRAVKAIKGSLPESELTKVLAEGQPEADTGAAGAAEAPAGATAASTAEGAPDAAGAGAARDILRLGDPLGPAVEIRPTPRDAAMAEVTANRMNLTPTEISDTMVPGELPIVRFRKDAAAIEAALPAPEEGFTRLWRGNRPGEIGNATSFTSDLPGIALPFREPYGGDISFVDVADADLPKYLSTAGAAPGVEFSLPPEIAAKARAAGVAPGGKPISAGMPAEPSVMTEDTIHAYLSGARVDNPVKVNLERIGSNEDIADALAQVSRTIPAQAVQSNEATIAAADALGMQPADFLNGYKGQNLNAAETTAMRFMLDSSAQQLVDFAQAARDPLADPAAKAQFLRAFTVHRSLQSYFENARAEAGRTLNAWSIMSSQRSDMSKAIGDLVRSADGATGDLGEMAEKIATLNPLQAGRFVAGSMQGNGRDLLLKVWYNSLLSSPTTVVKKLISDVGMATWNVATTGLAEKFGSGAVPAGETGELLAGYTGSFKDAVRAGWKALQAGESQFYREHSTWEGAPPGSIADQISQRFNTSMAWNGSPEAIGVEEPTRGAFEFIKSLMPTSWIAGADDFAKVWNYRAELRRLAWRASDGDGETFARLMDAPTTNLHQQAVGAALKNTFQEPLGQLGGSMRDAVDAVSFQIPHTEFELPLGRLIAPFTKVPFNIAKTAAENSPLALLMREPQRILSGGPSAARDLMVAKIGLGSGLSLALSDLALNNYLTGKGPTDPSLRREWQAAGNQPYSLQVPGMQPVRLNQIEPFGMTMGAIADTFNILKFAEDEKDFGSLIPSLALGIGNAMLSKTYFEGIGRFLDALAHPEHDGDRWAQSLIAGFAPQLASRVARSMDDWERAHYGYLDSIEEKLPFLRNSLPPQRTLWGDPVPIREGFMPLLSGTPVARVLSPMQLGQPPESAQPIDKWIWENRAAFPLAQSGDPRGIQKAGITQVFGQNPLTLAVKLNPLQYDRLQALAGNELKDPRTGMGAKDTLNSLVQGSFPIASQQREWDAATPEAKAMTVQNVVVKYRAAAKQQLLHDDIQLRSGVEDGLKERATALQGPR